MPRVHSEPDMNPKHDSYGKVPDYIVEKKNILQREYEEQKQKTRAVQEEKEREM